MSTNTPKVRVGIVGFGTVGRATAEILASHAPDIAERCGATLEVSAVCRRTGIPDDQRPGGARVYTDWRELVASPDVDLVVETMGGTGEARLVVSAALEARKPVVTANKNLLAAHGEELLQLAARQNLPLGFEAAVAGGIPVIRAIAEGTAGDRLRAVYGILNGTANYILTRMDADGVEFAPALAEAQRLGYAEADPTFDVDGFDARDKLAILARLAFGVRVDNTAIHTTGIRGLSAIDMAYARRLNSTIRLIGAAESTEGGLSISVRPWLVNRRSMLAKVDGVYNAVFLEGERVGTQMFYGRGAGGEPTGIAVVSDLMEIARDFAAGHLSAKTAAGFRQPRALRICAEPPPVPWYLRLIIVDKPGMLARIAGILAEHEINIDYVVQEPHQNKQRLPFVITAEPVTEPRMLQAAAAIDASGATLEPSLLLRVAGN
jgi:homoserine dehydrogenase